MNIFIAEIIFSAIKFIMILDHQFSVGKNQFKKIISVDLSLVKKYYPYIEMIVEKQEREVKSLQEHPVEIEFNFTIKDKVELTNFEDQICKLKKKISKKLNNTAHLDNLLYLITKICELEYDFINQQQDVYKEALINFETVENLYKQYINDKLKSFDISFYNKNSSTEKITISSDYSKSLIFSMYIPYLKSLLKRNKLLLIEIFGKKIIEVEFSYADLLYVISYLKKGILHNPEKVMRISIMRKIHNYIRENFKFTPQDKIKAVKITSDEARLIYFLFCICKIQPVLSKQDKKGRETKHINEQKKFKLYNEEIIAQMKKAFKDIELINRESIADYSYSSNDNLSELLMNEIF